MIAIDTNVLVRYYVDDDHSQHSKAKHFVDENEISVNCIVILETFWVLSRVYELSKEKVTEIFDHLKRLANVQFENQTVFARSLVEYRENGCDFADAMIGLLNEQHGYKTATFDKTAAGKLGFILL